MRNGYSTRLAHGVTFAASWSVFNDRHPVDIQFFSNTFVYSPPPVVITRHVMAENISPVCDNREVSESVRNASCASMFQIGQVVGIKSTVPRGCLDQHFGYEGAPGFRRMNINKIICNDHRGYAGKYWRLRCYASVFRQEYGTPGCPVFSC